MKTDVLDRPIRNSGIELLKIFACFLVVLSHTCQSLGTKIDFLPIFSYVMNLSEATRDVQKLTLSVLRYSGAWGNTIFFVCSAWFLLESKKNDKEKFFFMLTEVWCVSVVILIVTYLLRGGDIAGRYILKSLAPTTFSNNWYLTCYLLFYLIYPTLNAVIDRMEQKELFWSSAIMFVLYFVWGG